MSEIKPIRIDYEKETKSRSSLGALSLKRAPLPPPNTSVKQTWQKMPHLKEIVEEWICQKRGMKEYLVPTPYTFGEKKKI